jgi:hypothetical protein
MHFPKTKGPPQKLFNNQHDKIIEEYKFLWNKERSPISLSKMNESTDINLKYDVKTH